MNKIYSEIKTRFGEWLETGYSPIPMLIALLEKERENNEYYQKRIQELERKLYEVDRR